MRIINYLLLSTIIGLAIAVNTITFDGNKMPGIACNINNTINNGKPTLLTRVTSKDIINNNRKNACGNVKCPKKESCDEYPFASTKEGGNGAITRCVPVSEQNSQGGTLSVFYKKNSIKDGSQFNVEVINVPSNC